MEKKYNPTLLLNRTVMSRKTLDVDPVAKEYQILINIKEGSDRFKITENVGGDTLLTRESDPRGELKEDELERNKDLLGDVEVNKLGETEPVIKVDTFEKFLTCINMD